MTKTLYKSAAAVLAFVISLGTVVYALTAPLEHKIERNTVEIREIKGELKETRELFQRIDGKLEFIIQEQKK